MSFDFLHHRRILPSIGRLSVKFVWIEIASIAIRGEKGEIHQMGSTHQFCTIEK
jgi:hypothetical protein